MDMQGWKGGKGRKGKGKGKGKGAFQQQGGNGYQPYPQGKGRQHHQQQQQQQQVFQQNQQVMDLLTKQQMAPPVPAQDPLTEELLTLPPLVYTAAEPVFLGPGVAERKLVEILQTHRHRSNIPHELLKIHCRYVEGEEPVVGVPVKGAVSVEVEGEDETKEADDKHKVVVMVVGGVEAAMVTQSVSIVTKNEKLVGGGLGDDKDVATAAKRLVKEQLGVEVEQGYTHMADFIYRNNGELSETALVCLVLSENTTVTGPTGLVATPFNALLNTTEAPTKPSFELLAACDMLLESLHLSAARSFLSFLRSDDAQPTGDYSIFDTRALCPGEAKPTGLLDRTRLEQVLCALGEDLSQNEVSTLLKKVTVEGQIRYKL